MKTILTLLLFVVNGFGFDYDRMLSKRGFTKQDSSYYSKSATFSEYNFGVKYSECLTSNQHSNVDLLCVDIKVDCDNYTYEIQHFELFNNGIKDSDEYETLTKVSRQISISDGKYEIIGHQYRVIFLYGSVIWESKAIEVDSYEDLVCTEYREWQLTSE
jgi:hypothetical protein